MTEATPTRARPCVAHHWHNHPGEPLACTACGVLWPGEQLPVPVPVDTRPDWLRV